VFGRKRKMDEDDPASPDSKEDVQMQIQMHPMGGAISKPPAMMAGEPLSANSQEMATPSSLNYDNLTPRTVATLNNFVNGAMLKTGTTPTSAFYTVSSGSK
jgi:hypothetical protein